MRVHPLAPVVALDIDGHLGDYHGHFYRFLRDVYFPHGVTTNWKTEVIAHPTSPNWDDSFMGEFSDALGLEKHAYRAAKLAYRQGGFKRCMPQFSIDAAMGGVGPQIQALRAMGVQVWIATSRPWMRLDNVDPDTQYWLSHNVGTVDGVIYGEDKYADLIDIVGKKRILGVSDDLPENVLRARELGLNAALRRGPHNEWWIKKDPRADNWKFTKFSDLFNIIMIEWKGKYDDLNPAVL